MGSWLCSYRCPRQTGCGADLFLHCFELCIIPPILIVWLSEHPLKQVIKLVDARRDNFVVFTLEPRLMEVIVFLNLPAQPVVSVILGSHLAKLALIVAVVEFGVPPTVPADQIHPK